MAETMKVSKKKGRPKTVPDEVRRQKILEITHDLFLDLGYQGVSMAEIADRAKASLSTLYRLFPNKHDLFSALIEEHRRSMIALPGDYDHLPFVQALERIFWVDLDAETERLRARFVHMMIAEGQRSPELMRVFHGKGPEYSLKLLAAWLDRQHAAGRIHVVDSSFAARMLMNVAFGTLSPKADGDPFWKADKERTEYLRACFTMIAEGLIDA